MSATTSIIESRVPRLATYAGLLTVTLASLMYEIALTRIFSVTMWYHFAFVAISVALFGMTVGALMVYLRPERFPADDVERSLWRYSLLFGISIPICLVTQLSIPFVPHWTMVGVWSVVATCVIVSIPFVFGGVVVCLALTSYPARVNRLYAADLLGASLGAIFVVIAFTKLDGPSLVVGIGAVAAFGALCFALSLHTPRTVVLSVITVAVLGGLALGNGYLASIDKPFLRIIWAKEQTDPKHKFEDWNAFSRVTVDGNSNKVTPPEGWGLSRGPGCDQQVRQLSMVIDSAAATVMTKYDGGPGETAFLRCDVSNLAHWVRPNGDVLVIGVGGGRDILSALEFKQRSVTGVEINNSILHTVNKTYGNFTGHLDRIPNVHLVNAEARSYVARTPRKYDIIQVSLIDTWAATSAGAYALSENGLYTTDAWKLFFERLKPGGVLSVSRWYSVLGGEPLETFRTVSLASEALTKWGVKNPRDHILVYHGPTFGALASNVATVLVSPQPFTPADIARLDRETKRLDFPAVLTPTKAADKRFAGLAAAGGPGPEVARFREDISPPTDNRPFFFQMATLKNLFGVGFGQTLTTQSTYTLAILSLVVIGLALLCIVVPLLVRARRVSHRGMAPYYVYFGAIGLAFLFVEISQLQRLSIYLGHPTAALTVVLFSMLLFSGIGSMLAEFFGRGRQQGLLLVPLGMLLVTLIVFAFVAPAVVHRTTDQTTPVRIAIAVALLLPISLLMGMPFAIGMKAATRQAGAPTAFLWGINGATSVCASVLGTTVSIFFGISTAFAAGIVAYALAFVALLIANRRHREPAAALIGAFEPEAVREPSLEPA